MLRIHRLAAPLFSTFGARTLASAPCVYDSLIRFFVIDHDGKRHTVQGLVGTSVGKAMKESGKFIHFDDFTYSPDQPDPDAHVYVSGDAAAHLPKPSEAEQQAVELCGEEVRGNSRMASYLRLDKTCADMILAQAPNAPRL